MLVTADLLASLLVVLGTTDCARCISSSLSDPGKPFAEHPHKTQVGCDLTQEQYNCQQNHKTVTVTTNQKE